jgi:hypothetical protein
MEGAAQRKCSIGGGRAAALLRDLDAGVIAPTPTRKRKRLMGALGAGGLVAGTILAITNAPATGAAQLNTFAGSCAMHGVIHFTPPATNSQQSLFVVYDAQGTCSGELNGGQVTNAPITLHNEVKNVDGSCRRADTTEPGYGAMTFPDATRIGFTSEFHYVSTEGENTLYGEESGTAHGHGTFLTSETPPDVVVQCATTGAEAVPMDFSFTTDSPLVSPQQADGAPNNPHQLDLSVHPHRVPAGEPVRLRVEVTSDDPSCLDVRLRLGGQTKHTDQSGRATLRDVFKRPGVRRVKASGDCGQAEERIRVFA